MSKAVVPLKSRVKPKRITKRRFEEKDDKQEININKRAKVPIIKGERLPMNRLIETVDRPLLNKLLTELVHHHPEICKTIYEIQPHIEAEDAMNMMEQKFDAISKNLPYKGDLENDYSYLRVKPYLNEFLNGLSDYILNYLPPIENNLFHSLKFIDFSTNLIIKLPHFNNNEYKYIKLKCFEQIANTWLIILNNLCDDNDETNESLFNFIRIANEYDLKNKLNNYNTISENKFDKVVEFINEKFNAHQSAYSINELITIDYSNYSLTAHPST